MTDTPRDDCGGNWSLGDPVVGHGVPKHVRKGGATGPPLKKDLAGNGTAYEGHSVKFECEECGDVRQFATSSFMTQYSCHSDECRGEVRWFEFKWELNR